MTRARKIRRDQGMTEYIVIVGLIALLLIAAVNMFGFSLREAMQGTVLSILQNVTPPDGADDKPGYVADKQFTATDKDSKKWDVYPVWDGDKYDLKVAPAGTGKPTVSSPTYDPKVHGR